MRGDVIQVYIIMNGLEMGEWELLFSLSSNTTTEHSVQLKDRHFNTDQRKYFFTQHVFRLWNSLPQETIGAKNIARFKEELQEYPKLP